MRGGKEAREKKAMRVADRVVGLDGIGEDRMGFDMIEEE